MDITKLSEAEKSLLIKMLGGTSKKVAKKAKPVAVAPVVTVATVKGQIGNGLTTEQYNKDGSLAACFANEKKLYANTDMTIWGYTKAKRVTDKVLRARIRHMKKLLKDDFYRTGKLGDRRVRFAKHHLAALTLQLAARKADKAEVELQKPIIPVVAPAAIAPAPAAIAPAPAAIAPAPLNNTEEIQAMKQELRGFQSMFKKLFA